jgi:gamma-glutamyltranspeptidase/glutathione hydrolase
LRHLAEKGLADFYTGEIAGHICQDHEQNGGFIRHEDLADVPWPTEREPLSGRFGDALVHTLPPPGGGMALVEMLQIFSAADEGEIHPDTGTGPVLLSAIIRKVRQDRSAYRLKTTCDGVGEAAVLLDEGYAQAAAHRIQNDLSAPGETSHVSIIDRDGNAVAMTQSLERSFGSAAVCLQLGFLYNGYLRAFKVENRRHPHFVRPGAPARSNAGPTILVRDGKPWAVVGSTGSERMTSGIFQVLVRLRHQSPFEAVHAPRLHCTPDGLVRLEAERFSPDVLDQLARRGFTFETLGPYSFAVGGLQLATWQDGVMRGVADPRRDGAAMASKPGRLHAPAQQQWH